jgi:hypothetical protein
MLEPIAHRQTQTSIRQFSNATRRSAVSRIESIVASTPGFVTDDNGRMHPRGSESQVQYVIDGVPVTDNMSAIFSTSLDARTLRTVEVLTGGIPAEFGDKLAGVINVNTRSGLKDQHRAVFHFRRKFLNGRGRRGFFNAHEKARVPDEPVASTSQRYLDPPTLDNFHNFGRTGKGILPARLISSTPTTACAESLISAAQTSSARTGSSRNLPDKIKRQQLRDNSQNISFQHIFSAKSCSSVLFLSSPEQCEVDQQHTVNSGSGKPGPHASELRRHRFTSADARQSQHQVWRPGDDHAGRRAFQFLSDATVS